MASLFCIVSARLAAYARYDRYPMDVAAQPSAEVLVEFVERHPRLFVLTGAGCSTDSGIPDYRDASGEWKRARPIMFGEFAGNERARKRYWARSLVGYKRLRAARPNDAHHALTTLQRRGRVTQLVTQNVDGLHQAAGAEKVIDLHGRLDLVRCLGCDYRMAREALQVGLARRNTAYDALQAIEAPDGDADLEVGAFDDFDVPACPVCSGLLKPDVVFFGEGVPQERVQQAMEALEASDAMLVVGSSLMVYSGFRFARAMSAMGRPVAAVNLGRTRADHLLTLKIADRCAPALRLLTGQPG